MIGTTNGISRQHHGPRGPQDSARAREMRQMHAAQQQQGLQQQSPFNSPWGQDGGANCDQGLSPLQSMMGDQRAQRAGQDPLQGLNQEQKAEMRQAFQQAHSDGQVTQEERQALHSKMESFRQQNAQDNGQQFPPQIGQCQNGGQYGNPFGNQFGGQFGGFGGQNNGQVDLSQLLGSFAGGGYGGY